MCQEFIVGHIWTHEKASASFFQSYLCSILNLAIRDFPYSRWVVYLSSILLFGPRADPCTILYIHLGKSSKEILQSF
jgi:hypothetical protein